MKIGQSVWLRDAHCGCWEVALVVGSDESKRTYLVQRIYGNVFRCNRVELCVSDVLFSGVDTPTATAEAGNNTTRGTYFNPPPLDTGKFFRDVWLGVGVRAGRKKIIFEIQNAPFIFGCQIVPLGCVCKEFEFE